MNWGVVCTVIETGRRFVVKGHVFDHQIQAERRATKKNRHPNSTLLGFSFSVSPVTYSVDGWVEATKVPRG